MDAKEILAKLTLEEKASLCSGANFWYLKGIPRVGLPSIMVTDGPHGLRKQAGSADHLGISESVPATCFPTAATTACSFDESLLEEVGEALGEECQTEQVAVILGPGVNIKRSPLCGRNFEYFSEDPLLGGRLAGALIRGVQKRGAGTSLKHYMGNNQEKGRMSASSVIDPRAYREIYLASFEEAVKTGKPWTLMCSYNRVNGTYASEHREILTTILRDEWGFRGLVMTDWGAVVDRVAGVRAGLDLEMPGSGGVNDAKIVSAVKDGSLAQGDLDRTALCVIELILKAEAEKKPGYTYDAAAHHALARRAQAESAVLLKNDDNLLPLESGKSLAVIGAFAKTPRYQGAGSSKINPSKMESLMEALEAAGIHADYAPGYSLAPGAGPDSALIQEAVEAAKGKDLALVVAGLPDEYESEGFDRVSMDMPPAHNRLIEEVAKVNPRVAVVLLLGSPVITPWAGQVKAILAAYLGGQAGGGGIADIITGRVNPSGHLAETWPAALEDNPSYNYFPGTVKTVEYRESIFVGYRYYNRALAAPPPPRVAVWLRSFLYQF